MTGWQVQFGYLVTIQPVKSEAARQEALARWGGLPGYLDVEIENLRRGPARRLLGTQANRPHRHRPGGGV